MQIEVFFVAFINILASLVAIKYAHRMSSGESVLYSPLLQIIAFHIVFTLIGAHFFAYDPDLLLHVLNENTIEETQFNYALQMGLVVPFLVIGAYFIGFLTNFKPKIETLHYQQREIHYFRMNTSNFFHISYLFFFLFLVFDFYLTKINGFPILNAVLNLIAGGDSGLAAARSNINYQVGFPGWLLQTVRFIIPAISLVIFFNSSNFNNNLIQFFGRWLLIFISVFLLISNGERMPLIMFAIIFFVVMNYLESNKNSLRQFFYIFVFAVFFLGGFSFLLGRSSSGSNVFDTVQQIISDIFFRIFLSQAQTGSYIFQIYGSGRDFAFADIYVQNFSTYVIDSVNSFSVDLFYMVHGRSGSASHSAFAEAYASFGTLGIILVSFFLGMLCQIVFIKMIRSKKTILNSVFFGFLSLSISVSALGSITGIMYNGLLSIIFVYLLIKVTRITLVSLNKL